MQESFYLRRATPMDAARIWEILKQGVEQMFREGKHQWTREYPNPAAVDKDIASDNAWVLCTCPEAVVDNFGEAGVPGKDIIIAYGAVVYTGEPAYLQDTLKWLSDQPYVAVHRLAVADEWKRQGMAKKFMLAAEAQANGKGIHSFRIDTNWDNFYMQKLLSGLGFTYTGDCTYPQGARMCFEKLI